MPKQILRHFEITQELEVKSLREGFDTEIHLEEPKVLVSTMQGY